MPTALQRAQRELTQRLEGNVEFFMTTELQAISRYGPDVEAIRATHGDWTEDQVQDEALKSLHQALRQ